MLNATPRRLRRLAAALVFACLAQGAALTARAEPRSKGLDSQLAEFLAEHSAEPIGRIDLPPLEALAALAALPGVRADFSVATGSAVAGSNAVTVALWREAAQLRRAVVNARVFMLREVVVAARPLRSGETLAASDLVLEQREVATARGDMLTESSAAIGQRVRRHVGAGEPLHAGWLQASLRVKRGDRVTLRLARGPLAIETLGRAEEGGALGAWIRVRNLASKREVMGRIAADGAVHVEL